MASILNNLFLALMTVSFLFILVGIFNKTRKLHLVCGWLSLIVTISFVGKVVFEETSLLNISGIVFWTFTSIMQFLISAKATE